MRRRRALLGAAGVVLLAALAFGLSAVPTWTAERSLDAAGRKLGVRATAVDVSGRPGRVTLTGLSVRHPAFPGGAPIVDIKRVDVDYAFLPLLWGEVRIETVRVARPRIQMDLSTPSARGTAAKLLQRMRSRSGETAQLRSTAARRPRPAIVVTRGSFDVSGAGFSLRARSFEARFPSGGSGGPAEVTVLGLLVGERADDPWLDLNRLRTEGLPGTDEVLELASMEIEGGRFRLRRASNGGLEAQDTLERLRALRAELGASPKAAAAEARGRLPEVSIRGLRVEVDDRRLGQRVELVSVAADVRADGPDTLRIGARVDLGSGHASVQGTLDRASRVADVEVELQDAALAPVLPLWSPPEWLALAGAHATGKLHVVADAPQTVLTLDGRVELKGVEIRGREIAGRPLEDLTLGFSGRARVHGLLRDWAVSDARISVNGIDLIVSGDAHMEEGGFARIALDLALPPAPCNVLLDRLPPPLVSQLIGFRLDGRFGAATRLRFDRANPEAAELDLDVQNECRIVAAAGGIERLRDVFTRDVPDGNGGTQPFTTGPGSPTWTPVEEISPYLVGAVLTTEDGGFFSHGGFSVASIRTALVRDLRSGRFSAGASTISMQLAKNVFLSREKTVARKLQEAFFTWLLEQSLSKDEILELYLNVIEYGPGIYGVRNASAHFFGARPAELTTAQAIYLATVLPDPVSRYAQFERGEVWTGTAARIRRIAATMASRGYLDGPELERALAETVVFVGSAGAAGYDDAEPEEVVPGG